MSRQTRNSRKSDPKSGARNQSPTERPGRETPSRKPTQKQPRENTRENTRQETRQAPKPAARRPDAGARPIPASLALWGYHTVREALRSPRRKITALYATAAAATRLEAEIAENKLSPNILEPAEIDRLLPSGAVHQGLAARAEFLTQPDLLDLPDDGFVLVLDQITDPHNLGAIIRTAAAFALSAIVLTERNAPVLAGIVAKSASGGLEHVPVIPVVNLARSLEQLGRMNYWRIGLDSDGETDLRQCRLERPLALVLGAEGKGLRRLTRENCDVVARLDMPGAIKSLNVSNACAVALALASSQQAKA